MKNLIPRLSFALAGLFLLTLFVFPLWRITLLAPQYPDGVHMFIHINKIGGATPATLQNVNILNHYIGMKPIDPDSIPELKYFPYIIIFFAAAAGFAGLLNKKYLYLTWLVLFVTALILALYDFYLWEYDYGHNLDPKAPMKFDESFQPPLIGSKQIINFTAISMPHIGGYFVMGAVVITALGTYFKFKNK